MEKLSSLPKSYVYGGTKYMGESKSILKRVDFWGFSTYLNHEKRPF